MPTNTDKQEALAEEKLKKLKKHEKQLAVRITLELYGHLDKDKLEEFVTGWRTTIGEYVEGNSGGG